MKESEATGSRRRGRLLAAGILLGVGLGGFFDGIVLHQILQWHHMVSNADPPDTLANLQANTLADGLFHAVVTIIGVWLLLSSGGARAQPGSSRRLLGGMLIGWGGFNLVEGILDHYVLNLHHVGPGPGEGFYDLGFLVWGGLMCLIGFRLVRQTGTA